MEHEEQRSPLFTGKTWKRRECCHGYRFVWIRSKGAFVALLLTAMRGFECFTPQSQPHLIPEVRSVYYTCICASFPLLGLFSDVRFGRHKTLLALTIARVLLAAIPLPLVVLNLVLSESPTQEQNAGIVYDVLWFFNTPIAIWFSILTFTFGLDQLLDAPSSELSVFIHWRLWGLVSVTFVNYILGITISTVWITVRKFLYFLSQIVCLLSLIACHRSLNLQPQTRNPLNLIASVLRYAANNSRPKRRSAFTYWQDEAPSRLDMGKEKFGGPFTEEQVEDVKTFFRLVPLVLVAITVNSLASNMDFSTHLSDGKNALMGKFFTNPLSVINAGCMILLLVHLCIVFPFYHRHHPSMLKKIGIGCYACVIAFAFYLVIETVGHLASQRPIQCMFNHTKNALQEHYLPVSRYIMYAPFFLQALTGVLITPVTGEFCFAQTPHSMKSLMYAIMLGWSETFSSALHYLPVLFIKFEGFYPSCGFYFYLMLFVATLILSVLYCVIAKRYKFRVREEIYHAHYVVENIFEDEFDRRDREETDYSDSYSSYPSDYEEQNTPQSYEDQISDTY